MTSPPYFCENCEADAVFLPEVNMNADALLNRNRERSAPRNSRRTILSLVPAWQAGIDDVMIGNILYRA
jgi:hypothetical protein